MVAGTRVPEEKVHMADSGVFGRADRRPRGSSFAQGSWVAGVTTCQPGECRAEKTRISGLEYVRSESIQGEILSQQLIFQPGVQERGPLGGINLETIGILMVFKARRPDDHLGESPGKGSRLGLYPDAPTS